MSCIVVFGREPLPGSVKTRLAEGVGEEVAAVVYRELLRHTLGVATSVASDVVLAVAEPPVRGLHPPVEVAVEVQSVGDLGRRMAGAFERRFAEGYRRVVVIGSDCPSLAAGHLQAALAGLESRAVVLGPAADGGYWLIGLREPAPALFDEIPWSTDQVLARTLDRLATLGLDALLLPTLSDLDTAADLERILDDPVPSELRRRLQAAVDTVEDGDVR